MRLLLLLGHRLQQMEAVPGFRLYQKMPKRGIHLHVTLVAGKYVYRKQKSGGESIFTLHDAPINSLRKHLFADLQPYVCPWDQCLGNTTTFRSRNTWVNHVGQEHTLVSHWNGLACPLCLESVGDGLGAVSVHIARHLEDIALAAIPRNVDSDDGSNSEGDTSTSAESINSDGPTMSDHQQRRPEHIIQDTGPSIPKEPHDLVNRLSRSRENQVTSSSNGYYRHPCIYRYQHNCPNWVWQNGDACGTCLVGFVLHLRLAQTGSNLT